jgi:hypothetical protein
MLPVRCCARLLLGEKSGLLLARVGKWLLSGGPPRLLPARQVLRTRFRLLRGWRALLLEEKPGLLHGWRRLLSRRSSPLLLGRRPLLQGQSLLLQRWVRLLSAEDRVLRRRDVLPNWDSLL